MFTVSNSPDDPTSLSNSIPTSIILPRIVSPPTLAMHAHFCAVVFVNLVLAGLSFGPSIENFLFLWTSSFGSLEGSAFKGGVVPPLGYP